LYDFDYLNVYLLSGHIYAKYSHQIMNKRIPKFQERDFANTDKSSGLEPPIKIIVSINSHWGPGDNFVHQNRLYVSLSLITFGNAIFEQDGRHGILKRGDIFMAHKGSNQMLKTGSKGVMHKRSLILAGATVEATMIALHLTGADFTKPRNLPLTMSLFRRAHQCLAEKKPGFDREASIIVWTLLLNCAEGLSENYPDSLRLAIEFIQANLHHPVKLQAIALSSRLSARHCTRLFKEYTGLSPINYCIQQRMAMAKNLVVNTNQPFKQVATSLGYENALRFSVQFKQHFKISPRHYRKRSRGHQSTV